MTNDVRLWLYPGASPGSDPTNWEAYFADISAYVRRPGNDGGAPITYSGGKQDESPSVDAGQMTLTLDNRDGRFSTDKIDGPYYGLLDLNTPIRLGVVSYADTFTRTVSNGWGTTSSTLGQSWTTPGTASNYSVDGSKAQIIIAAANTAVLCRASNSNARDVDVTMTITPAATATGAAYGQGAILRYSDTSNYIYSALEFNTGGTVSISIVQVVAGVSTELASLDPIPSSSYTAGQSWELRTQADGDTIRVMAWPASGSQPTSWHATGTQDSLSGTQLGVRSFRFSGNTNSGATSLLGLDDFTAIALEFTGSVVSWPVRWDVTGSNSWAPITAAGVLRRLRQGSNPVQSPLRRQLSGVANTTGYWPMEEGSDAKYFLGTVVGGATATFTGVTPGADNTLAGGGAAPVLSSSDGSIYANAKTANNGNGFAAMFFVKLTSLPSTKTRIARIRTNRGPVPIWDLSIDNLNTYVEGMNSSFTVVTSATNGIVEDWTNWMAWQLETDNSGGSTAWSAIYHAVGKTTYWAQTGSVAGTTNSNVSNITLTGPSGTAFAHIWLGRNTLPFVTDTFSLVSSGYAAETAADRFARVCGEAGIPYSIAGAPTLNSEKMGVQKEGTTLAILQSCADADYGVMAERGAGLEFVPREYRWNLTQTAAISVAAGQVGAVPQPTRDDQRLRNRWTISRLNGGSGSYQDDTSVARNGTWEDSATLNVFDDSVLENHAAWRVAVGTTDRMRWPSVTLDLVRNPTLGPVWRQRTYGWRLGITTGMTQVRGNEPDLIVEGFQATLTPETWTVELNCSDASIWAAAVTDDTGILGRVDTDGCTTTGSISSSATGSLPVTTIAGYPTWDSAGSLWSGGVDLNLGGERITVNAVSAAVGQAQTFTITARGVNGYAASHPAGTSVSLWNPARVAL